jgi:threonine-phosphate decarboxylase
LRVRKELKEIALCAHGGKLQEIAIQLNVDESSLLDYSVNLNPYMPLAFEEALRQAYNTVFEYPDNRYVRFRESAARFAGVSADNIIPGNGSTEIIRLIAEAVLERGDTVAIPCPTFGEYEQQCRLFGAAIRHLRFDDIVDKKYGQLDGCRAVFLCNPNNPDGRLVMRDGVEGLIEYCRDNDIITIVDEAFIDLADPGQSVAQLVENYDNLLVMRSLTKCFAIPGLRLGFGIAGKETADILNKVRLTWNLDSVAEEIGIHYMDNTDSHLEASRAFIKKEREWLAKRIGAIKGIKVLPASANYFLVDVGDSGMTSGEFFEKMLAEGIIVRDCRSFNMSGGEYARLAVRAHEDNERLGRALSRAVRDPA